MKYDAGRVDKVMTQLDAFDYETGAELIAWLHRQVDETNYAVIACGDWPHNECDLLN